ncbi:MAG: hypothetical protein QMC40_04045 [Vicingaceae bacterium]|jgi:hypothetical protein|tara:strand:- start:1636 stop:2433 length:798 start_codon:yes stop_codon:yes gene_type:complete
MKKKVLLIAALFTAGLSFAQDGLTSKKGVPILPEAGDWAIGFDASSLLNYGGNLLNGNTNNGLAPMGDINANTIYGKYFVDANKAYRGMLRLGFGTTNNDSLVADIAAQIADPSSTATVEDEVKTSSFNITVGGGMEYRRGKGRLQGVYGPVAMISLGTSGTENTYGNAISANNAVTRTTETKAGSTFGLAIGGFGGVEYFFAPKMSLGAEIGWTIALNTTGVGESTSEAWDGTAVVSTTIETGGSSAFGLDTRPNANITLNFHF